MARRIRAITFDFWGTLFHDANLELRHTLRVNALREVTGVGEEAADKALREVYRVFFRTHVDELRTLDHRDGARMCAERLEVQLAGPALEALATRFGEAILEHPAGLIDGAGDAVRAAASRLPIGLISDTGISPGSSLSVLLQRHDLKRHFGVLTYSDLMGVSKPRPVMFEHTAGALGVAPGEILHLGDLEPTDIVGAQGVGGQAGLFAGVNEKYYDGTRAEYRFKNWYEFLDQLEDILA